MKPTRRNLIRSLTGGKRRKDGRLRTPAIPESRCNRLGRCLQREPPIRSSRFARCGVRALFASTRPFDRQRSAEPRDKPGLWLRLRALGGAERQWSRRDGRVCFGLKIAGSGVYRPADVVWSAAGVDGGNLTGPAGRTADGRGPAGVGGAPAAAGPVIRPGKHRREFV